MEMATVDNPVYDNFRIIARRDDPDIIELNLYVHARGLDQSPLVLRVATYAMPEFARKLQWAIDFQSEAEAFEHG